MVLWVVEICRLSNRILYIFHILFVTTIFLLHESRRSSQPYAKSSYAFMDAVAPTQVRTVCFQMRTEVLYHRASICDWHPCLSCCSHTLRECFCSFSVYICFIDQLYSFMQECMQAFMLRTYIYQIHWVLTSSFDSTSTFRKTSSCTLLKMSWMYRIPAFVMYHLVYLNIFEPIWQIWRHSRGYLSPRPFRCHVTNVWLLPPPLPRPNALQVQSLSSYELGFIPETSRINIYMHTWTLYSSREVYSIHLPYVN